LAANQKINYRWQTSDSCSTNANEYTEASLSFAGGSATSADATSAIVTINTS
jgi:hypothetical protein